MILVRLLLYWVDFALELTLAVVDFHQLILVLFELLLGVAILG